VRKGGESATLLVQDFNTAIRYRIGTYNLEVLSLPRLYINDVVISQSKTTTVQIPNPGIASFHSSGTGYGSVYVEEGNELKWICSLSPDQSKQSLTLLPGKYRVVYRAKNAREAKYTVEKSFRITSGSSQVVELN
jgi:Ca-activated chloride channel family protein